MAFEGLVPAEFFTHEGRLGSFQQSYPIPKRRASGATKGPKNLTWPHAKYLLPEDLAKAGFVWRPFPENPDNVACFLCNKSLDGWEEGDNALEEHLKHSPDCGWAIVAGIEANVGDLATEDPSSTRMIAARKATFGGRWPHEGKRGWKCKTKQLAEAGWKYTPSVEYDDMATCTYCELALDGWEQGDKPMEEHHNRSPECPYFALKDQYGAAKKTKTKAARGSKNTSRLSVQSVATAASDITSIADATAEIDDSVLTTASVTAKKGGRAKKATATKARKTKAKRDEPVEVVETELVQEEDVAPPSKPARGRKRTSDDVDGSAMTVSEAPAPKKRTARGRAKATADSSVMEQSQQDISITDAAPPAKAAKGRKTARASGTKGTRKASGASQRSTASTDSMRAAPGAFPEDDDDIQRQLEADLERPLTDDDDIMQDSDSERKKSPEPKPKTKKTRVRKDDTASPEPADSQMFDAEPYVADEDDVDEELKELEAEMTMEEPEAAVVAKKGQKAIKQTKAGTAKAEEADQAPLEDEDELSMATEPAAPVEHAQTEEPVVVVEEDEISMATVATITSKPARAGTSTGRKRGRPSKKSLEARACLEASKTEEVEMVEPEKAEADPVPIPEPEVAREEPVEPERETESHSQPEAVVDAKDDVEEQQEDVDETAQVDAADDVEEVDEGEGSARQSFASARQTPAPAEPEEALEDGPEQQEEDHEEVADEVDTEEQEPESEVPEPTPQPKPKKKSVPPATSSPAVASSARHSLRRQPGTPRISPAQSARQPAVSPSPSPQSSDAENQPPSSRSATAKKRVTHAPLSSTPSRPASPTKRKVLASLQSTTPWNPVDIDLVFGSPEKSDKRNAVDRLLHKGTELTSPEKRMTVEEWIHFNANQAEQKLRQECEAMVSKFENEGTKAMNVLEGLIVE